MTTRDGAALSDEQACWLMADLLQWHRREAKPEWWKYFARLNQYDADDFITDTETLGGLELIDDVGSVALSTIWRYRFQPGQEHRFYVGDDAYDPATRAKAGKIFDIDNGGCTIDLKRGNRNPAPHPQQLMPGEPVGNRPIPSSLRRVAEALLDHGVNGSGPHLAARRLVGARPPIVRSIAAGADLRLPDESSLESAIRVVGALEHSMLPVQGPPGTGKTYTAARIIVDRVKAGERVAVTAFTHSAIANLLRATAAAAVEAGTTVNILQKYTNASQAVDHPSVTAMSGAQLAASAANSGEFDVIAGTAWFLAREDMLECVDTLIVDEAGQMSLANVVAVAPCARNVVLIGDPQQLSQPSKGSHPDGAGVSALEHLLAGASTVPPDRGLLLEETRRLHPDIAAFISEQLYDQRLHSFAPCAKQTIEMGPVVQGAGLRFLGVNHVGNKTSCDEEAEAVGLLHAALLGRNWTDHEGIVRPMTVDDILVVTPYNAQLHLLSTVLPNGSRIGTVDKFQGQEAPVVIVSMVASTAEDVPRGMEFLYSRNRLNVAVSRAKALTIVVASPRLLDVRCHSIEQMRLANMLCRYVELAEPVQLSS